MKSAFTPELRSALHIRRWWNKWHYELDPAHMTSLRRLRSISSDAQANDLDAATYRLGVRICNGNRHVKTDLLHMLRVEAFDFSPHWIDYTTKLGFVRGLDRIRDAFLDAR